MLSSKEPVPVEFFRPITAELGLPDSEVSNLLWLHTIQEWRKRLVALARAKALRPYRPVTDRLAGYLLELIDRLAMVDEQFYGCAEETYLQHLMAAHFALTSVVEALKPEQEHMVFRQDNVARHVRYPTNYYMAALMNLSDDVVAGGTAFGEEVQRLVNDVIECQDGRRFLEKLSRQHGHHMNARFGRVDRDPEQPASLLCSGDIHDRRMYLIGRALREGAADSDWHNLFDAMRREDFQQAVLAFDTSHYGDVLVDRDGWMPHPGAISQTALRYMVGFIAPDPRIRSFAAMRMKVLIEHSAPSMLRHPALLRGLSVISEPALSLAADAPETEALLRHLLKGERDG
jgi:hypothetical protein